MEQESAWFEGQWSDPGMTRFPELEVTKGILLDVENETGFYLGECDVSHTLPKIELHRPGIEPGPPALQAGTLPKELSTL